MDSTHAWLCILILSLSSGTNLEETNLSHSKKCQLFKNELESILIQANKRIIDLKFWMASLCSDLQISCRWIFKAVLSAKRQAFKGHWSCQSYSDPSSLSPCLPRQTHTPFSKTRKCWWANSIYLGGAADQRGEDCLNKAGLVREGVLQR